MCFYRLNSLTHCTGGTVDDSPLLPLELGLHSSLFARGGSVTQMALSITMFRPAHPLSSFVVVR